MNSWPHTYSSDPIPSFDAGRASSPRVPAECIESWSSLCYTTATAVAVEALLKFTSLPHACSVLGVTLDIRNGSTADGNLPSPKPEHTTRRVLSIHDQVALVYARLPLPDTCLRRALTAGFRLRRFKPRLVLGVKKSGSLAAHAWLEFNGVVLDWANTHDDYVRLSS